MTVSGNRKEWYVNLCLRLFVKYLDFLCLEWIVLILDRSPGCLLPVAVDCSHRVWLRLRLAWSLPVWCNEEKRKASLVERQDSRDRSLLSQALFWGIAQVIAFSFEGFADFRRQQLSSQSNGQFEVLATAARAWGFVRGSLRANLGSDCFLFALLWIVVQDVDLGKKVKYRCSKWLSN